MLNKVIIMGRLVRDPELRHTKSNVSVCTIRIACDRDYKGEDKNREADFVDVVAWRHTADFISKYFTKGRLIVVEGRLQSSSWTDQEGRTHYAMDIKADSAYFGDSKHVPDSGTEAKPVEFKEEAEVEEGELPF